MFCSLHEGEHAREEPQTNWFSDYASSHLPSIANIDLNREFPKHHKRYQRQERRSRVYGEEYGCQVLHNV